VQPLIQDKGRSGAANGGLKNGGPKYEGQNHGTVTRVQNAGLENARPNMQNRKMSDEKCRTWQIKKHAKNVSRPM